MSPGWKGVKYQRLKLTLTRLHDASCKQHTARGVTTPILYPLIYTTSGQTPRHASMIDDVLTFAEKKWRSHLLTPYSCMQELYMWRDARGSHAHTKPNFTTTSSSSAQRSADCYLQFPEDRSSWRRHGILHADPAEVREEDPDPRPQELRHRRQGSGEAD